MSKQALDTINKVEDYLNSIPKFSTSGLSAANFNLDRMIRFCEAMGNPEKNFTSIHVAGTNGKGTTCQMLASVYETTGYKTALYTSPHLVRVHERFKVNGSEIGDEEILKFFNLYYNWIEQNNPTFFELTTAIAFWYFSTLKVDIAIIETGLGGRLDATNVIDPLVSVITSVGMDHMDVLGDTIPKIAGEKAGIIKPGRPVVVGNLPGDAMAVIQEMATLKRSRLYKASDCNPSFSENKIRLKTTSSEIVIDGSARKRIDAVNAAIVYQTVRAAQKKFPVADYEFQTGIEQVDLRYPYHAHFEKLLPDRNWFFDGAHNPEAVEVLIDELLERSPVEKWMVVLSFMKDKLNAEIASLWSRFPNIVLYRQDGERAAATDQMKNYFPDAKIISGPDLPQLTDLEQSKSELVIFSGSFYFYEKVRRWMGTTAAK